MSLVIEELYDALLTFGDGGALLALALIIWIDGTLFPTLPEVWLVLVFGIYPESLSWGTAVVLVATAASLTGNFTLYSLVKVARLPHWIERRMRQYTNFLLVKDEKLLLLNRLAPVVPYTGAFMAVCNWNLRKCLLYLSTSAVAKFSAIGLIAWASYDNLRQEIAPWVSIVVVLVLLAASVIASFIYRKRQHIGGEPARSQ
jgi:membrane protein YqaA with SNARE-associated domain